MSGVLPILHSLNAEEGRRREEEGRKEEGEGARRRKGGGRRRKGELGKSSQQTKEKKTCPKKCFRAHSLASSCVRKLAKLDPKVNLKNLYKPTPAICDARKDMVPSET